MRLVVPNALLLALLATLTSPARAENPVVRFTTILGAYDVELCEEISALCSGAAPISVANFLAYVDDDRYPPTGFIHRRGTGPPTGSPLVIQGGGYWVGEQSGNPIVFLTTTFPPIALEVGVGLSNLRGTIAMARSTEPVTATSQWFVNLVDNVNLDTVGGGYAVFGKVVDPGMEVVDAIGAVPFYNLSLTFSEIPLKDYQSGDDAYPYLVYVHSVERVPEPGAATASLVALVALAALAALPRRRA